VARDEQQVSVGGLLVQAILGNREKIKGDSYKRDQKRIIHQIIGKIRARKQEIQRKKDMDQLHTRS